MNLEILPHIAGLYYINEIRFGKRNKRRATVERVAFTVRGWQRGWRVTWHDTGIVQFYRTLHELGTSIPFSNANQVYMDFLAKGRYGRKPKALVSVH
jgi:hypothetical protein